MKIKDASHAVRVLEALVEQTKRGTHRWTWNCKSSYFCAMVDGAKAVTGQRIKVNAYEDGVPRDHRIPYLDGASRATEFHLIALAQAYAPHMESAGMKVPE